jgi:hypothetical protein
MLPVVLLAASILACGLLAGGQDSPSDAGEPPTPAATEPAAAPAPEAAPPPPPSDFAEVLDAEVAAGAISYEQGLIRLLRSFLGDDGVSLPEAYGRVVTTEGNSIVERAGEYIADGPDEAARAEMAQLLDVLFPSPEKLEAYSRPATSSRTAPGVARPPAQIDCVGLYRAGFPLAGVTTYPCFEYISGSVGGVGSYTIYYPAVWYDGHPDREWLEPANAAAIASMETFGRYGPIGHVNIIFSLAPDSSATYLAAVSFIPWTTHTCPMVIYPAALALSEAWFQQAVAHEMFHCFQLRNFRAQMHGVHESYKRWWTEGTAEYFSNVAYPHANYEHRWTDTFDYASTFQPLYRMGYETFGFFQFLANQADDTAVLDLIGSMPTSGGPAEQERALASLAGIEEALHRFGRAYLDSDVFDTGGRAISFSPETGASYHVPLEPWNETFNAKPFVLQRFLLEFEDDARFSILADMRDGEGRYAVQPDGQWGFWTPLPERLNTACDEKLYQVLITTANPGLDYAILEVETLGEALPPDSECECLVGTWTLDNDTALGQAATMLDFGIVGLGIDAQVTGVNGDMTIVFEQEGSANGTQTEWTIDGEVRDGEQVMYTRMAWSGGGTASWRSETVPETEDTFVVFEESEIDLSMEAVQTSGGIVIAKVRSAMSDANVPFFLSGSHPYTCTATTLTIFGGELPPVTFTRLGAPPAAP